MKLRMVYHNEEILLYCQDGTILKVDDIVLKKLFICYKETSLFTGTDGAWAKGKGMKEVPGTTLAYVNDDGELCICDANPFYQLMSSVGNEEYVTLREYAEMHSKGEARIKVLCKENKLTGAVRKGGCWFIPINAPYPEDARKRTKQ